MEVSQWEMRCDVCLAVAPGDEDDDDDNGG
jgi:hypothetical protein